MEVRVFEDNGGMIHAVVFEEGKPTNIISGFEDLSITKDEFIEAAKSGFEYSDPYDPAFYSGKDIEFVSAELEELDDLIAEITKDSVDVYPESMGIAGGILFEIYEEK